MNSLLAECEFFTSGRKNFKHSLSVSMGEAKERNCLIEFV